MMATKTPKFNPDIYTTIKLNHLVVYSIYYLHHHGIDITPEDIISACFTLFPKRFSLKKYSQWPDTGMVSRHWSDSRRKGYLAAKTEPGFKLTAKGSRLAEKVAKILGVAVKPSRPKKAVKIPAKKVRPELANIIIPAPVKEKVIIPTAPVVKIETPRKQARTVKREKKIRPEPAKIVIPAPVKEKVIVPTAPVVKIETPRKKTQTVKAEKKIQPEPAKIVIPAPVKEKPKQIVIAPPAPVVKVETSRKQARTVKREKKIQPEPAKIVIPAPVKEKPKQIVIAPPAPVVKVETSRKQTRTVKREKKVQPEPAKIVIPAPVKEKVIVPTAPVVTQEEKVRAGKFVRMMETSDAYRQYRKNGAKSNFGEFDFRSLLLCTMESSPETLAKNVELFKGYAGIHNRQDLIAFLVFCRDKFSYLLVPQKKSMRTGRK